MLVEETTVPVAALAVDQFKDHLRLGSGFSDDGIQDGMLGGHLRASMAAIEARTGKILIEREFSWTLTAWRDDRRQPLPVSRVVAYVPEYGLRLCCRFRPSNHPARSWLSRSFQLTRCEARRDNLFLWQWPVCYGQLCASSAVRLR